MNQSKNQGIITQIYMATYLTLSILLMNLILSATAADMPSRNKDLLGAIEEMQRANYFTFVMLVNMSPPDRIPGNITFLMPNDRMLSKITLSENAVLDFLFRHSIPFPLLFDNLKHFPTGSILPTSKQDFMLRVSNNGRRSFYLNNVQIISPDICTAGSSIRCHGINGVLMTTGPEHNSTFPSPTCSAASPETAAAPTTPSWPLLPPPLMGSLNLTPMVTPPPAQLDIGSQKSGSSQLTLGGLFYSITTCMMLSLVGL
ncbi:hypothetical protein HHK36_000746 [Tetracentron sinense]|uniref:FAS1 domain-containing protein n=1 Tax=Tetracentron sinense TaxID=13715 RepID=A0A835A1J9_TETSI|nr:hypothetical protein HHK36_000746 [Tetracentron sinense]